VEPTCPCQRGRGVQRHYSFGDIVALRLVKRLCDLGFSPKRLKPALQRLRKIYPKITLKTLPAKHVVTDGRDILLHDGAARLERLFDGQYVFAFVLELGEIRRQVIKNMPRSATG
jgi:DNA-binding transcriptional MerR regulator